MFVRMRRLTHLLLGMAMAVALNNAWAQKPPNITEGEMALAPPYCIDTMGFKYGDQYHNTSPRAPYWISLMGKSFWAMHHYCWAQINLRRALTPGTSSVIRQGLLTSVIGDYHFVLKNSSPDFVMLPEILTRLGEAELLRTNVPAAYDAFERARKLKPDYWPPYVRWAEVLIKNKRDDEAKSLIQEGLRNGARDPVMDAMYRRLGGDPAEVVVQALPKLPAAASSAPSATHAPEAASSAASR